MRYLDLSKNSNRKTYAIAPRRWPKFLVLGLFLGAVLLVFLPRFFSFSNLLRPISVFSQIINPKKLQTTDGRTNTLLLAVDKRETFDPNCGSGGSGRLTDTIIVASLDANQGDVVLISVPRDLWVETGYFTGKINSAYAVGERGKVGGGAEFAARVLEGVLGIPIHYYAVADFQGFQEAVDILGGIEVAVERTFDDYKYPVPGKECAEPEEARWEHIHFEAGLQTMNGGQALKFVRSRHAAGPEGSDFARSRRQQQVLVAMKTRALALSAFTDLTKVKELYDTYSNRVQTNLGFLELQRVLTIAPNIEAVRSEVIDGVSGLLQSESGHDEFNGAWVLVPKAGDFSEVRAYVQQLLFGDGQ